MTPTPLEDLFLRYRSENDLKALAQVFDRTAPHLLSLARRLASDQADDILQDTFLAAIENAAAWNPERPLVPWLMGILTHRAQRTWKDSTRQPDPERLAQSEVQAPDSLLMAKEFQASLDQALQALSPVLRQTVNASLFEGQSPTQLAVNLGLEPGTIRQRLRRGLGELRLALKGSLILLLSLFGLRSNALAATRTKILQEAAHAKSITLAATGIGAFGTRWVGFFALVAIVAIAATPLWNSTHEQVQELKHATLAGVADEVTLQPHVSASNQRVSVDGGSASPEPSRTLSIQVLWKGNDQPATNRAIVVTFSRQDDKSFRTNELGQLRIPLNPDDFPRFVHVSATDDSPSASKYVGSSSFDEDIEIHVDHGGSLSGQVLDHEGQPVPHAVVEAWQGKSFSKPSFRTVEADAEGYFLMPSISDFCLIAHVDGFSGDHGLKGKVKIGEALEGHVLTVAPDSTVAGIVLCPDGTPAVGARIKVRNLANQPRPAQQTHDGGVEWFQAGTGEATTDAQGGFEISGLPPRSHGLNIRLAPFIEQAAHCAPLPERKTIQLDAGESLSGLVLDNNGTPVPDAEVCYWPHYGNRQTTPYWNKVNPGDGSFVLSGMLPRRGQLSGLVVRAPGYAVHAQEPLPNPQDDIAPIRLKLSPGLHISGKVFLEDGTPARRHLVRIEGDRYVELNYTDQTPHTWEKVARNNETRTDPEGRFELTGLYSGTFKVKVFADEKRQNWLRQEVQSGGPELSFHLRAESLRKVVIHPKVIDGSTGEDLTDFKLAAYVFVDGYGSGQSRRLTNGKQGLEASGIEPGEYRFYASKPGYVEDKSESRYFDIGDHNLKFTLWPMRTLQVQGVTQNGTPIPRMRITGTGPTGDNIIFRFADGGGSGEVFTSKTNSFLHGLPAGPVQLLVECDEGTKSIALNLAAPNPEPLEVIFQVTAATKSIETTLAIWVTKQPSDFEPGDKATLPKNMHLRPGLSRENKNTLRSIDGYQLSTPEMAFTIVIERPQSQKPIRVTYGLEDTSAWDLIATKLEAKIDTDKPKPAMRMGLTVWPPKTIGTHAMSTTMSTTSYPLQSPNRDPREPLSFNFSTPEGECSLRLTSDYYEDVEFTWFAEEASELELPPILILKAKK